MKSRHPTILVVGATGKFAHWVVPALIRKHVKVRALVRTSANGEKAMALGASEFAIGDLRRIDSIRQALDGVEGVFHIGPAFAADEAAMGVALVEEAERAGVWRFVFSSVIQPTNSTLANHASKMPVEEALYTSKLAYTILQPANFLQNIAFAWPAVLRSDRFVEPFPCDTKIARVDYRDVAEVAAIALSGDRLSYATLELAAGMFDRNEVAAIMSTELGKTITAGESTFSEWVAEAKLPYGERELALLSKVHDHYRAYGLGGNSVTLTAALGRPPFSLGQFIRELAMSRAPTSVHPEDSHEDR